jgi:hypothetical protein
MLDLTSEDLVRLKEAAEGATPGPWQAEAVPFQHGFGGTTYHVIARTRDGLNTRSLAFTGGDEDAANARLIASCDPQTILALVRMAREGVDAQKRVAELHAECERLSRIVLSQDVSLSDLATEVQAFRNATPEPLTDDVKARLRAQAVSPSHGAWTEDAVERLIALVAEEVGRAAEARVRELEDALRKSLVIFDWMERRSIYQDAQVKNAHEAARSTLARCGERCPRCGGAMRPGKAMVSTVTGTPDFPGCEVVTMSPGGPGRLVDCLKCEGCGHSVHAREQQTGDHE